MATNDTKLALAKHRIKYHNKILALANHRVARNLAYQYFAIRIDIGLQALQKLYKTYLPVELELWIRDLRGLECRRIPGHAGWGGGLGDGGGVPELHPAGPVGPPRHLHGSVVRVVGVRLGSAYASLRGRRNGCEGSPAAIRVSNSEPLDGIRDIH
eukprot:scaffold261704_cov28-Prasinocladus_malaysianus.AAC.1